MPSKPEEVFAFVRRAQELQVQLGLLDGIGRSQHCVLDRAAELVGGRHGEQYFLQATPIDVAPILKVLHV